MKTKEKQDDLIKATNDIREAFIEIFKRYELTTGEQINAISAASSGWLIGIARDMISSENG